MVYKDGSFIEKDNKKYLICKTNKSYCYVIEITDEINPEVFYNKFKSKPKSYKIEDFCKITGMFKQKIDDTFLILNIPPLISEKDRKKKGIGISPCCAISAKNLYIKKHYSGKGACKKCGKLFNIIKLENDDWLSLSQNLIFYQINLISNDIRNYKKEIIK